MMVALVACGASNGAESPAPDDSPAAVAEDVAVEEVSADDEAAEVCAAEEPNDENDENEENVPPSDENCVDGDTEREDEKNGDQN